MSRAKVFCVPSVVATSGDAEGFGIVFIEAQAMGLPVVSTLSGGIPEAVEDGQTGLLVAEDDRQALAEAIITSDAGRGVVAADSARWADASPGALQPGSANSTTGNIFHTLLSTRAASIEPRKIFQQGVGPSFERMQ